MSRLLTILLACIALAGLAAGLVLVLGSEDEAPPSPKNALLARGGGPDGSRAVTLTRWRYRADPNDRGVQDGWAGGDWRGREVSIPHSANARAHSGAAGRRAYRGSIGWYAREIDAPAGGIYVLRFESAHYRANVYVDGKLARSHTGAYEPFAARARLSAGRHTLAVRVDWRDPERQANEDWQRAWFNYGGLHRPVTLARLGPSQLDTPTVRTRLRRDGSARVDVSVRVRDTGASRRIEPTGELERDGVRARLRFEAVEVGRGRARTLRTSVVVEDPDMWSPASPDRYALRVAIPGESSVSEMVGLREITWDGGGFYVNGDPLQLRGASLPADARGHGDALTGDDEDALIEGLRKIGANATRSQMPLAQSMLAKLDAAGIFVWQEVGPWEPAGRWRATTPAKIAQASDRAVRAAKASRTHPSILAWTLTNEAPGQGHPGQQRYAALTARRLHAADPGRPVAADLWGSELPHADGLLFSELDAIGVTDYIGWYEGPASAAGQRALASARIGKLRALFPDKPLVVAELGSAGSSRMPPNAFGGLRFQARLLARRIRQLAREPGLSGTLVWSLRDYALRPDFVGGSIAERRPQLRLSPGLNEKGLYDFAGEPKPALAAVREAFDAG
jgi:hypothetical protein